MTPSPPLTTAELESFAATGVLVRRGFVPAPLVRRARQLVDDWYRTWRARDVGLGDLTAYTRRTFAPELGDHPALLALLEDSGATEVVRQLIPDIADVRTVQIQIRLPEADRPHAQPVKALHVDGVACPHLDPTELRTFSLLVGVVLSEIDDPAGGALRYVPGGHLRMAEWFRDAWALGITDQVPSHLAGDEGVALLGSPGDLLLLHHLVPHAVGRNETPTPRVMAYFRVSHADHAGRRLQALRDPWLDYPTLAPPPLTRPPLASPSTQSGRLHR